MPTGLLLVASVIFLAAFIKYNKGVFVGTTAPVFATWVVFAVTTSVNVVTYSTWGTDWAERINTAVLFTDCLGCIATLVFIVVRRKAKLDVEVFDRAIMLISLIGLGLWCLLRTSKWGHILNLGAYSLAFVPTYRSVLKNPSAEPTKVWLMWSVSLFINIAALTLKPETQNMDYISPLVYLFHHSAMVLLSMRRLRIK